jgi:hypothetical protein
MQAIRARTDIATKLSDYCLLLHCPELNLSFSLDATPEPIQDG